MIVDPELQFWLVVWLLGAVAILVRQWRAGGGVGLVFAYVLSFAAIHWLAAALYAMPWYSGPSQYFTLVGLRVSAIGLIAFGIGCELGAAVFSRQGGRVPVPVDGREISPRIVVCFIVSGAVFYAGISPLVAGLPTIAGLASTGAWLMIVGVIFGAWNAWQRGHRLVVWIWLAASIVFPAVTVVGQGFLGFGFAAMVVVATFIASVYRPRWHVVVAALLVGYVGLSVYVTYMRDRRDIRAVVWGGAAVGSRLDQLAETLDTMEWFDVENSEHLWRVDDRLNQNHLVGRAVESIDTGLVEPALGGTLIEAALALIPRAIWPNKPVMAGSGDLVSTYTGLTFAGDTSVGIGHVMEWYVNFTMPGVVLGFALFGTVLVYVDRSAFVWLYRGHAGRFAMWFMPGISLLVVGGSFVELTGTAAASAALVWLLRRVTDRWDGGQPDYVGAVVDAT